MIFFILCLYLQRLFNNSYFYNAFSYFKIEIQSQEDNNTIYLQKK